MRHLIDNILRLSEHHKRTLSVVGAAWFALGCAVYARFLELPEIPYLTKEVALYSGAAYNAIWWGFARPAIERRTKALKSKKEAEEGLKPRHESIDQKELAPPD